MRGEKLGHRNHRKTVLMLQHDLSGLSIRHKKALLRKNHYRNFLTEKYVHAIPHVLHFWREKKMFLGRIQSNDKNRLQFSPELPDKEIASMVISLALSI